MHHNVPGNKYWGRLYEDFPDFQLALARRRRARRGAALVPTPWDGTDEDLPSGWDEAFLRAFESGREPDVLCALAISVRPDRRRRAGGADAGGDARAAAAGGLRELIAPVRPTLQGALPADSDRALHGMAPQGRQALRPVDPRARAHRRRDSRRRAGVDGHRGPVRSGKSGRRCSSRTTATYIVPGMLAPLYVRDGSAVTSSRTSGYDTGSSGGGPCGPARAGGAAVGSARCSRSVRQSRRGRPAARWR